MEQLKEFLQQQKILAIAPHAGDPWIANVYLASEIPQKIYFVGNPKRHYGALLMEDPKLAFGTAWHDPDDIDNRKGVQGIGTARMLSEEAELEDPVKLYCDRYPGADTIVTVEFMADPESEGCMWEITPSYIKYWSDEDYGQDGSEEFTF